MYGHKWTSSMGESAVIGGMLIDVASTWASGLRGVSGNQIAEGLRACMNRSDTWPPSLPEFVALCKGKGANEFGLNYVPECYRQPERKRDRLLSNDDRNARRSRLAGNIAALRAALGSRDGVTAGDVFTVAEVVGENVQGTP